MPMLEPYVASGDIYVLPSYLPVPDVPVPGFGNIVINSYLIRSQEPILIDAGMPVVKEEFLRTLWSLIDPQDLRWVFLTHDDGDHTGAFAEVLEAAPQARVVTQFVGLARLETAHHVPIDRVEIRNPGDRFEAGGRDFTIVRPPLFDSPATSAYLDSKTGVLFCADSFGALIPNIAEDVTDVPESDFYDGFYIFNRLNHPWFALVDPVKFEAVVNGIRQLQPQILASCHAPFARGARVEAHLKAMASVASMEPLALPDQAALEGILGQIQGGAAHPDQGA